MTLLGLSAGQLLALFAGAAAITVALYLLKRQRRIMEVPYLPLWETVLADKRTTALLSRLRHLLSLLLALAIVGLLVLSLGDPRAAGHGDGEQLLILIDTSPSMTATDVLPSRLSQAKDRARQLVEGTPPGTSILVASLADSVLPMGPASRERSRALAAIERITARPREASLRAALAFAQDVVSGAGDRLVLVSDGRMAADQVERVEDAAGLSIGYLPVGRRDSGNLVLSALEVRRYPLDRDHSETLVRAENRGPQAAEATLELRHGARLLQRESLSLAPGEAVQRVYPDLAGIDQAVEARIIAQRPELDRLAMDSRAFATVPARRRARVLCVTRGSLYLQAALLLDEYLTVDVVAPDALGQHGHYDAVIFDDLVPPAPPQAPAIYLHPAGPGRGAPFAVEGEMRAPHFSRIERDHPLVRWTALSDVNIASALRVTPAKDDVVVARAPEGPLVVAGTRSGQPFVALTFRPEDSDLPLRAAWPLLLLNAIDSFQSQSHRYRDTAVAGESTHVPATGPDRQVALTGPDGTGTVAGRVQAGVLSFVAAQPGLYRSDDDQLPPVAAQLSGDVNPEIASAERLSLPGGAVQAMEPPAARPERSVWLLLLVGAVVLLLFEWLAFHRRWTV